MDAEHKTNVNPGWVYGSLKKKKTRIMKFVCCFIRVNFEVEMVETMEASWDTDQLECQ